MANLLITGADGFFGLNLLSLSWEFDKIYALVLPEKLAALEKYLKEELSHQSQSKIHLIVTNFKNLKLLDPTIPSISHIIHCAGEMRGYNLKDYHNANKACIEDLLIYLEQKSLPKVLKRIVLVSSQAVTGATNEQVYLNEDYPCQPWSAYGETKLAGEKIALAFANKLPITILRPCSIYGKHDLCFLRMFKFAQKGWFGYFFAKEKYFNIMHISDLVRAIQLSLEDEGSGQVYFISDGKTHTWLEIKNILEGVFAQSLKDLILKGVWAELYFKFFDLKEFLTSQKDILSSEKSKELKGINWLCSPNKFNNRFNFQAKIDLYEGFKSTAEWYLSKGLLSQKKEPSLIPFAGKNVPHIVIEVNQKCNISCQACYKDKFNYTKPLDQIINEIQIAMAERNLTLITLAGGEPTLHPQLLEVIRYIRTQNIQVQILSNGLILTHDLLKKYKEAGLKEIYLHVDSSQKRPDALGLVTEQDFNLLRNSIAERIIAHDLICSMSVTLYKKNLNELADIIEYSLQSPHITRILFTCCKDFHAIGENITEATVFGKSFSSALKKPSENIKRVPTDEVQMREAKDILKKKLNMMPFGFIASSKSDQNERWLIYYSFVIKTRGNSFHYLHLDPQFGGLVKSKYEKMIAKGERINFGKIMNKKKSIQMCLVYALTSLNPKIIFETAIFLFRLLNFKNQIFYKDFTFQQGPSVNAKGEFEFCKDCPDATIRNGVLVPVCMADILIPFESENLKFKSQEVFSEGNCSSL